MTLLGLDVILRINVPGAPGYWGEENEQNLSQSLLFAWRRSCLEDRSCLLDKAVVEQGGWGRIIGELTSVLGQAFLFLYHCYSQSTAFPSLFFVWISVKARNCYRCLDHHCPGEAEDRASQCSQQQSQEVSNCWFLQEPHMWQLC